MTISSSFFHTHSERDRRLRRLVYRYCFFSRCGVKLFMVFSYCCRFDLRVRLWKNSTKLLYKTVERTIVDNYFFLYISNLLLQTSARGIQYFSFVPLSSYFRRPVIFFFFHFSAERFIYSILVFSPLEFRWATKSRPTTSSLLARTSATSFCNTITGIWNDRNFHSDYIIAVLYSIQEKFSRGLRLRQSSRIVHITSRITLVGLRAFGARRELLPSTPFVCIQPIIIILQLTTLERDKLFFRNKKKKGTLIFSLSARVSLRVFSFYFILLIRV